MRGDRRHRRTVPSTSGSASGGHPSRPGRVDLVGQADSRDAESELPTGVLGRSVGLAADGNEDASQHYLPRSCLHAVLRPRHGVGRSSTWSASSRIEGPGITARWRSWRGVQFGRLPRIAHRFDLSRGCEHTAQVRKSKNPRPDSSQHAAEDSTDHSFRGPFPSPHGDWRDDTRLAGPGSDLVSNHERLRHEVANPLPAFERDDHDEADEIEDG